MSSNNLFFDEVSANRAQWTGPAAYLRGNVSGGLFWLSDAAYVAGALEAEPVLTPEQEKALASQEVRTPQVEPRIPRESWQTEYDRPEFEEYLREPLGPVKSGKN